jgi:hypothetical protein
MHPKFRNKRLFSLYPKILGDSRSDPQPPRRAQEKANPYLIPEEDEPFLPSKGWADMIRKVYETDPLLCPKCGGQMQIIAFIEDHKVIDRIIAHLKLTFEAERPPPPQSAQQELLMAAKEKGEYF